MAKLEQVCDENCADELTRDFPGSADGQDYTLAPGGSVWITVGSLSVWLRDDGQGLVCEVLRKGDEGGGDAIDSMHVDFGSDDD
jgi:hypothetical protein